MRADIHDGPEHTLQSEVGYIDARPYCRIAKNLLHRTAGPYIGSIAEGNSRFSFAMKCIAEVHSFFTRHTDQSADHHQSKADPMCSYRSRIVLILAMLCMSVAFAHGGHQIDAIAQQPRTPESDIAFRKNAPPLGSVRLTNSALAIVRSFMRQVRRTMPHGDQIAWIGWASEQQSKRPSDEIWKSEGAGWVLGAYSRTQVPPDVIDKVRGIEIVFSAEEPSSLIGKTIDVSNRRIFVRD
jgi:hypothetical protein